MTDLSRDYMNSAFIAGGDDYYPRWQSAAAAFRGRMRGRAELDIAYGPGPRQAFDLFHPEGMAKGLMVFIHGGYWLACAGDEIWVDDSTIVGSIGVIFASFGFPELMARQGVERRVVTAGKSKSFADPFLPQKPEDIDRLRALQGPIHEAFIAHVKARRGARLAEADLFNADVWVGQQAVDLGLVDGVAHLVPKLKALYGDKVRLVPLGQKRGLLARFGLSLGEDLMQSVEDRALWARYGL